MLKPIHRVDCSPALAACQRLMQTFALWLCEPSTTTVTRTALRSAMPTQIEADWLWTFLERKENEKPLLDRARAIVKLSTSDKVSLADWVSSVADLSGQFGNPTRAWPIKNPDLPTQGWRSFKTLFQAFYSKGLRDGLPYQSDGTPVGQGGVTYAQFVAEFRTRHRQVPNPNAREVCVLCGGPLGETPEVDHWVGNSPYPLLSVCADNLLPICGTCNSSSNKGTRSVHSQGRFDNWFHPYLRPGYGRVQPKCDCAVLAVKCLANATSDQPKADNLNRLLHLSDRWTREFKAEYSKLQKTLRDRERRRLRQGQPRHTAAEVGDFLAQWSDDLQQSEPHYEVHALVGVAVADPSRLGAWHTELSDVTA